MAVSLKSSPMPPQHSCCPNCRPNMYTNPFGRLVEEIREYLGDSSGIDSADVDPNYIKGLMTKYSSDIKHWERHAYADKSRNYTRNYVDTINGKANLVS